MPTRAAIFLMGQTSARVGESARSARVSAKKTPAAKDIVQKVYDATYEAGVLVRTSGANIILSPPLIITAKDVERIVAALDAGLAKVAR